MTMTPRAQVSPLSSIELGRYKSLVDILRLRSERQGDELLYRFLATGDVDGPADEWSYARLDRAARAIAASLGAGATGERVLLLFPPGLDFVAALMGCLYAGAIAVPTYPPDPGRLDRTLPRLRGIAADCGARLVLTTSLIKSMAEVLLPQAPELGGMAWIAVDDLSEGAGCNWQPPAAQADGVALLQYTSGSTGAPKGVVLTHTQILHNERLIRQGFGHETCVVGVGWLPVFHDMGLIGNVLQPLYHGFPCTLMSPLAFLQRPLRWLQAISRFGATTSGGPNFAYELCIKKVPNAALAELDLRSWAVAFNGAEPTRSETMQRFAERFAPCGFRAEAFYACYGLAEATLIVSGGRRGEGLRTRSLDAEALARGRAVEVAPGTQDTARTLVSVGRPGEGLRVVVVDPQTGAPRAPGAVGEIWVAGSSVGVGYWGRAEESAATFGARLPSGEGPFLRTGDLGFFAGDELFVTGRLKDLLILRGRNVYPQDVELTVEHAHPAVRPGCVAAFAIDEGGEERLAVVAEVGEVGGEKGVGAVADAVRRAVAEEHAVSTHLLALIPPRSLPKTSSGKVQRSACRQALLAGELEVLARSVAPAAPADAPQDDARAALEGAREEERLGLLEGLLRNEIARRLGADPSTLDARAHLASLGLDSLGGLELQEALETALGVTLPATFLWQSATLGEGAAALEAAWSQRSAAPASGEGAGPTPGPVEGEWPLSPGQFRLWFLERLMPQTPLYHVQFGLRMQGPLDERALAAALNELVARHAALRTVFREVGGVPRQLVRPTGRVELERLDLRAEPPAEREAALERHALEAGRALFDLEQGPLMRASLARCGDEDHVLLMTQHHLITDGWSIGVLARELSEAYAAIVAGGSPAPAPPLQYPDFARWQLARRPALGAQRAFWAERLRGMPVLELRTDLPRPRGASVEGATVRFALPRPLVDALRALGRREGGTLYVTLLAAFAALLHRYSGQEDFGVGAVTAQRERPAVRGLVGFLTNTLAIRCQFGGEPTFAEFVRRTRDRVREALLASELPFEDVVAASVGARGADYNPLFRASFLLERLPAVAMPAPSSRWTPELRAPDGAVPGTAKFDLSLALAETEDGLDGALEYRADLFHEATVRRFAGHFEALLRAVAAAPDRPLCDASFLTEAERRTLLAPPDEPAGCSADAACVHHLFEAQAARTPDAVAVAFDATSITYAALRRRARRLSARLRALGVGPEARVGVLVERSIDVVVALLGVLGAGGAYVPLDPDYPPERLRYMLADSGARVLVTQGPLAGSIPTRGVVEALVDAPADDGDDEAAPPPAGGDPAQLCYVIYTSGSTGRPKGVMVPHGAVTRFFAAMDERVGDGQPGAWLAVTSVSFDISVLELLWTLCRGFAVVIRPESGLAPRPRPARDAGRRVAFSLFYFADDAPDAARDRYRLLLEGARFADESAFLAVWTPERHFHAFGGLYPNPSVTSAALAMITKRVGLRAGSVVLPLHHPVRVAEEWSVVDNFSGGRVGISVASGWRAEDFIFAPERYASRRGVLLEGLETVRRLWRGETVLVPGVDGAPVEVQLRPRPVQPELPVWLTAAGAPDTFRAAGAAGANVLTHLLGQSLAELEQKIGLYREAFAASGAPGRGQVTLMLHTYLGADPGRVRADVERPLKAYLRSSLDLMKGIGRSLGIGTDAGDLRTTDLDRIVNHAFERYFESSGLFGTPRECRDLVERARDLGVDEVACLIDFGVETDAVLASLPHLDQLRRQSEREASRAGREPISVAAQLRRHGVTHLQCTPSTARALLLDRETREALAGLKRLMIGGEALPAPLAEELLQAGPGRLMNMYGPTETTIWSATHAVTKVDGTVPLGTPTPHNRIYVLDRGLQPTPLGVPGEIYIGGRCVARGYHGRPALTSERFLPDPHAAEPGARMYRTGDVGRWRADGRLEFLGRTDQQVKLRGYRIELGEVEADLARHPGVREAVAVVREDAPGDARLVAYVAPAGPAAPGPAALRAFLEQRLPAYMVPSTFVQLDRVPRTPNGKVDRGALPTPSGAEREGAASFVAPRGQLERQIAEIWARALRVEQVGAHDNFFDLGGHSLLMVQVHHELQQLRPGLPLVKLLEHPTVSALATHLSEGPARASAVEAGQDRARRQLEVLRRQRQRTKG